MVKELEEIAYPKVNGQQLTKHERHIRELRNSLKGKSLQIYYYLTKNPEYYGVREIQRKFDYSSPNLAQYHLKRLYEAKLLKKNDQNQYKVIENPVKLGALEDQIQIMNIWLPHSFIYAISLLILALFTLVFFLLDLPSFIYPLSSIPVLTVLAIQLIRDGIKITQLKTDTNSES